MIPEESPQCRHKRLYEHLNNNNMLPWTDTSIPLVRHPMKRSDTFWLPGFRHLRFTKPAHTQANQWYWHQKYIHKTCIYLNKHQWLWNQKCRTPAYTENTRWFLISKPCILGFSYRFWKLRNHKAMQLACIFVIRRANIQKGICFQSFCISSYDKAYVFGHAWITGIYHVFLGVSFSMHSEAHLLSDTPTPLCSWPLVHIYIYTYACIYTHIYIYIYVYMYVYVYICICVLARVAQIAHLDTRSL